MLKKLLMMGALLISTSAYARDSVPLVEVPSIAVPQNATLTDVKRAIVTAAVNREWTISGSEPGTVFLTLAREDSAVTVAVKYDMLHITIAYSDSRNFGYGQDDQGRTVIHPRYHSWLRYLYHDTMQRLNEPPKG